MKALAAIDGWPVEHAAAGIVTADGVVATRGEVDRPFRWASVTKLVTAVAALVALEEGTLELDVPAGPPGSTVRHLLAHASGLSFEGGEPVARPGHLRIYSNAGFNLLGRLLGDAAATRFDAYVGAAVLAPLRMARSRIEPDEPRGAAAAGGYGPLGDLLRFAAELLAPRLVAAETLAEATTVAFPGLDGVLPGFGRLSPCDWGLGFELRDGKSPHWTGSRNSPQTFGHFGGSGTFLWVDPVHRVALACLTDREFDDWALPLWPALADAVLGEL